MVLGVLRGPKKSKEILDFPFKTTAGSDNCSFLVNLMQSSLDSLEFLEFLQRNAKFGCLLVNFIVKQYLPSCSAQCLFERIALRDYDFLGFSRCLLGFYTGFV